MPLDQDLIFGRAAHETVRYYGGVPFRLEDKLDRLTHSARLLDLPPVEREPLRDLVECVADAADGEPSGSDTLVRLYWTSAQGPGESALDRDRAASRGLAMALTVPEHLEALRRRGIRLVSLASATDGSLRASSPWLLPGVKSSGSAAASAAWFEAQRREADDGILVDLRGRVLEGPATNIWWRKDRTLFTPSRSLGVLPGITSAAIAELAGGLGYEVSEGQFPLHELADADEAFVTSTVAEVVGAIVLDGNAIGAGSVGPAARELHGGLRALASATG